MSVRSFVRIGAAAVLGCGISVGSATSAGAACKSKVWATGNAKSVQYLASVSSKYAWKAKVRDRYGASYSTWSNAKGKSVNCKKSGPNNEWQCTAGGRPCA
jgi:hypothetical protein